MTSTRNLVVLVIVATIIVAGYVYLRPGDEPIEKVLDTPSNLFRYKDIEIQWLVCASFRIKDLETGVVVYTDPYKTYEINHQLDEPLEKADYVFVSHTNHIDHFSRTNVLKLSNQDTTLILPSYATSFSGLPVKEVLTVSTGETLEYDSISFEFVPMYNVNKRRSNGELFHSPEENHIGTVMEIGGVRIYFAGSTDIIPEMEYIQADIVILPIGGYAFMTPKEAAQAVDIMSEYYEVKWAIPMHYGYLPNFLNLSAADKFAEEANCSVAILEMSLES